MDPQKKNGMKVFTFLHEFLVDKTVQVTATKRSPFTGRLKTMNGVDVAEHLVQVGYAERKKVTLESILELDEALVSNDSNPASTNFSEKLLVRNQLVFKKSKLDAENNIEEYSGSLCDIKDEDENINSINDNKGEDKGELLIKCEQSNKDPLNVDQEKLEYKGEELMPDGGQNFKESTESFRKSLSEEFEIEDDSDYISGPVFNKASIPYEEGDEFYVVYLGLCSSKIICCHLVGDDGKSSSSFQALSEKLQNVGDKQIILLERPRKGKAVIARNMQDGKWYRAVMTDPSSMRARFVDFGTSSVVEEVRRLPEGMHSMSEQAIKLRIISISNLQSLRVGETWIRCRLVKLEQDAARRRSLASVEIIEYGSKYN